MYESPRCNVVSVGVGYLLGSLTINYLIV